MIFLSNIYTNRRILSLRTGSPIGHAHSPIISNSNLKIEGWHAEAYGEKGSMILPVSELRDVISKGFVVDDHDAITPAEDMVRMQDVIETSFELKGMPVETEDGRKLGKVQDYAIETKSLYVQKLYVSQSIFRSLSNLSRAQSIIDRSQIIDVTPEKIIVREAKEEVTEGAGAVARA